MKQFTVRHVALLLGLLGLIAYVISDIVEGGSFLSAAKGFVVSLSTELFGIALTVIVIDWLYEKRDEQRRLRQLIREMGSSDNQIAGRAASELRAESWLADGSLIDIYLVGANLQGAKLDEAYMAGAKLLDANLSEATLGNACLTGANLANANLSGVYMEDANLQNANLEQANFTGAILETADLSGANLWRANLKNAHLQGCNFSGAKLQYANLEGAQYLTDSQLKQAWALKGAIMPNGQRYDGRFALPGDVSEAKEKE